MRWSELIGRAVVEWFPKAGFLRNVTILAGGTFISQAIMVLALPILTRFYSPKDFSLLAVYVSILGIITVVSCLRYNIAAPLPEDDADGMALIAVSLVAAAIISALCALPVLILPTLTAKALGQPGLLPYLWMIPAGTFVASIYNSLQYWATRKKRFAMITKTRITRAGGGVTTQLSFGLIGPTPFGLMFGHMIYGGLGIIALVRDIIRNDRDVLKRLSFTRAIDQAKRFRAFPIYSVPEALSNTASIHVPIIIIAALASEPEAGFLFLAMKVIGLPMNLIGSSVSQVFHSDAPTKHRDGELPAFTRKTMLTLFKVGALPLLIVGLLSPFVFPLAFGEEWARAGWLVACMTPWFILQFVVGPVSIVLQVTGLMRRAFYINFAGLCLRLISVSLAALWIPATASYAFALSGFVFCAVYALVILKSVQEH